MRVLLALVFLAACASQTPEQRRVSEIRLHCMSVGSQSLSQQAPRTGYQTYYGLGYQTPGGLAQGMATAQAGQFAERECLRSYGLWP